MAIGLKRRNSTKIALVSMELDLLGSPKHGLSIGVVLVDAKKKQMHQKLVPK